MRQLAMSAALASILLLAVGFALFAPFGGGRGLANRVLTVVFGSPLTPYPTPLPALADRQIATCAAALGSYPREAPIEPYWPPGLFWGPVDHWKRSHYSTVLCSLGEGPLSRPGRGTVRLRFLWTRSFDPAVVIRIEHSAAATTLYAVKEAEDRWVGKGTEPGPEIRTERTLTSAHWRELETLLADAGFWYQATDEPPQGLDGAHWTVEVSESHRYHLVDRWSDNDLEPFGLALLRLSGLDPEPIY